MKTVKRVDLGEIQNAPDFALVTDITVAALMSCSRGHVWRLVASGKFPEPERNFGLTRWRLGDIRRMLILGPTK